MSTIYHRVASMPSDHFFGVWQIMIHGLALCYMQIESYGHPFHGANFPNRKGNHLKDSTYVRFCSSILPGIRIQISFLYFIHSNVPSWTLKSPTSWEKRLEALCSHRWLKIFVCRFMELQNRYHVSWPMFMFRYEMIGKDFTINPFHTPLSMIHCNNLSDHFAICQVKINRSI